MVKILLRTSYRILATAKLIRRKTNIEVFKNWLKQNADPLPTGLGVNGTLGVAITAALCISVVSESINSGVVRSYSGLTFSDSQST